MTNSKKEKFRFAESRAAGQTKTSSDTPLIPSKYQHAAAIAVIFVSLIVFFHEIVFEGKVFQGADTIASKSFETYLNDAKAQGIFPLWNPYIFCGMPGYASLTVSGERLFDISAYIVGKTAWMFPILTMSKELGWELFYYFVFGIGIYLFAHDKLKNKVAALISALAVMHSTFIVILIMVGHMTKVPVLCFFPFIFLILERLREKFNLVLSLALVVLIHFMFLPSHFQMIFYCYFALLVYYIFFFVRALIKKENWLGVIRSGVILAAATGLAFAMTGDQYLSTLEYSKYSMRGADPIVPSQQAQQKGEDKPKNGGLDYDYATNWSFSPGEMWTFFIPSAYGFGWHKYQGSLTNNQEVRLNTYFGQQPFTDAPQYMGIVILVLAGVGFWRNRKEPFVQYLGVLVLLALLISFGKEFSLLYDAMFYYFPMFNKFRIPSMILILVQMFVPVLAGYGIVSLFGNGEAIRQQAEKKRWQYTLGALSVLFVISIAAKDVLLGIYQMFISEQEAIQRLSQSYNQNVAGEIYKIAAAAVSTDITVALLVLLLTFAGFYLHWNKKMKFNTLAVGLVAIALFDLWRVNFKPMEAHDAQRAQQTFATPDYVSFLKQDTTLYRILEFENGQPPYNNMLAYWRIQSAYGYQGAKMRQIQDVFDVVGLGNPLLWELMNVKYIISDQADSNSVLHPVFTSNRRHVLYNRAELPRAFFVNKYEVAKGIDILNNIKQLSFNPREVAYFMEDPKLAIEPPLESAAAQYTHYGIQDLELKVKATGNNLLFLSESWYPEGWKAFVDGNEIPIYRINYMFRGIVVPQGEHTATMKFEPPGFYFGKMLSLWLNIGVLAGLGFMLFMRISKKKKDKAD